MRVAVADPSRTVCKIMRQLLQGAAYEVWGFEDGESTLLGLQADPDIRALITSSELGEMSGHELCRHARDMEDGRRPLYIIMMSSSDDRQMLVRALDSGADDFVRKPLVPEELKARLRTADRLTSLQLELRRQAQHDMLTGAYNRRGFFDRAQGLVDLPAPALSAIMVDVDHFKKINDTYGHHVGDEVLRVVSARLGSSDWVLGRLGGEEFCILTTQPLDVAAAIAERIRGTVQEIEFRHPGLAVTCSLGVSVWRPGEGVDHLLRRADMALYEAKSSGRNRVVVEAMDPSRSSGDYVGTIRAQQRSEAPADRA